MYLLIIISIFLGQNVIEYVILISCYDKQSKKELYIEHSSCNPSGSVSSSRNLKA